jgi:fatty-acyl-CoA synthase
VRDGDRVATLMWNQPEHLEAYFAIPSIGAVIHTLNPRLHPDELSFIVDDAEDCAIIVDESLLEAFEGFRHAREFKHVIVVSRQQPVPDGTIDYESLIESHEPMQWPALGERRAAAMCYTSGTTGRPKGVVYSHRALVLHSLMAALPDANGASAHDTILPVVPMFHANAWGLPYTGTFVGAAFVLPGPKLDAESVLDLMADERVTLTAGLPTVWMAVLQALDAEPDRWDPVTRCAAAAGRRIGCARSLLEGFDRHGLTIIQAWGMTETSPLGERLPAHARLDDAPSEQQYDFRSRQGVPIRSSTSGSGATRADRVGRRGRWASWRSGAWVAAAYPVAWVPRSSPRTAGSRPGTSSRSTPRVHPYLRPLSGTWSSPAASGSPRSIWKIC